MNQVGSFQPDARFTLVSGERDGDGVWETQNYASADYKIDLVIDQGPAVFGFADRASV